MKTIPTRTQAKPTETTSTACRKEQFHLILSLFALWLNNLQDVAAAVVASNVTRGVLGGPLELANGGCDGEIGRAAARSVVVLPRTVMIVEDAVLLAAADGGGRGFHQVVVDAVRTDDKTSPLPITATKNVTTKTKNHGASTS